MPQTGLKFTVTLGSTVPKDWLAIGNEHTRLAHIARQWLTGSQASRLAARLLGCYMCAWGPPSAWAMTLWNMYQCLNTVTGVEAQCLTSVEHCSTVSWPICTLRHGL